MNKHNERAELIKDLRNLGDLIWKSPYWHYQETVKKAAAMLEAQPAEQAKGHAVEENEADDLLRRLGLDPERYRTDGGYINHMKVRAAILHPESYPRIDQCQHEFVHSADLGGRVCKLCGKPERVGIKQEPQAQAEPEVVAVADGSFNCNAGLGQELITLQSHREATANLWLKYCNECDLTVELYEAIAKKDAALKEIVSKGSQTGYGKMALVLIAKAAIAQAGEARK